jgi:transcriptional antiterminator Rof (Rho-off)
MSHLVETCDFIDMFEESAKLHRPLVVTLSEGRHFEDTARDVVTEDGADYVVFRQHGRVAARDVLSCVWPAPRADRYDSKL